jgi:hypothetical protein
VYNIFVDGQLIAENVLKCDLKHKIEIIEAYCQLEKDLRNSKVTYDLMNLNSTETIA